MTRMSSSTHSYFRPGNYVRLHDSETAMLVTNDNGDGTVICFWFCEQQDKLVWQKFACADLRSVDTDRSIEAGHTNLEPSPRVAYFLPAGRTCSARRSRG